MGSPDHDPDRFADELQSLKRTGCSILVVGPPTERSRCEDLLGEDDRQRKRIVVATDHEDPPPVEDGKIIDGGAPPVRSVSQATTMSEADSFDRNLASILDDIGDFVGQVGSDGVDPGELRVCFGDLETLTARDDGDIEPYVESVSEMVRENAGMGHCHLPATSPLRDSVEGLFDITVEVRSTPEGRQQRWLLHDADLDSGWLAIDD